MFSTPYTHAWERSERFGNVPFYKGSPMMVQERTMMFAPANQKEIRLTGKGWFSKSLNLGELEERSTDLINSRNRHLPTHNGIRDERYFLISLDPDVVIISPFEFKLRHKTTEELKSLAERIVPEVLNPMYAQIKEQQKFAKDKGVAPGLLSLLPSRNYVEIGCTFPDIASSSLWAPSIMESPVPFDEHSRINALKKLGIDFQRHPNVNDYWKIVGCPT